MAFGEIVPRRSALPGCSEDWALRDGGGDRDLRLSRR